MGEITCPYCNKSYSVHRKLLAHLELAPQQGNRHAEIRSKLEAAGTSKQKRVKIHLNLEENMPEFRLQTQKFNYQLQPITRLTPKERIQRKKSTEGPQTTPYTSSAETPKKDQPMPHGHQQRQRERKMQNQTPKTDFLQVPTKITRSGKDDAREERRTQDT